MASNPGMAASPSRHARRGRCCENDDPMQLHMIATSKAAAAASQGRPVLMERNELCGHPSPSPAADVYGIGSREKKGVRSEMGFGSPVGNGRSRLRRAASDEQMVPGCQSEMDFAVRGDSARTESRKVDRAIGHRQSPVFSCFSLPPTEMEEFGCQSEMGYAVRENSVKREARKADPAVVGAHQSPTFACFTSPQAQFEEETKVFGCQSEMGSTARRNLRREEARKADRAVGSRQLHTFACFSSPSVQVEDEMEVLGCQSETGYAVRGNLVRKEAKKADRAVDTCQSHTSRLSLPPARLDAEMDEVGFQSEMGLLIRGSSVRKESRRPNQAVQNQQYPFCSCHSSSTATACSDASYAQFEADMEALRCQSRVGFPIQKSSARKESRSVDRAIEHRQSPFCSCHSSSAATTHSDASRGLQLYDPETNCLSLGPQFLCYRPSPRARGFLNEDEHFLESADRGRRGRLSIGDSGIISQNMSSCMRKKKDDDHGKVDAKPRNRHDYFCCSSIIWWSIIALIASVTMSCLLIPMSEVPFRTPTLASYWSFEKIYAPALQGNEDQNQKDLIMQSADRIIDRNAGLQPESTAFQEKQDSKSGEIEPIGMKVDEAISLGSNAERIETIDLEQGTQVENDREKVADVETSEVLGVQDGIAVQEMSKKFEADDVIEEKQEENLHVLENHNIVEAVIPRHRTAANDLITNVEAKACQEDGSLSKLGTEIQPLGICDSRLVSDEVRNLPECPASFGLSSQGSQQKNLLRTELWIVLAVLATIAALICGYTKRIGLSTVFQRTIPDNADLSSKIGSSESCPPITHVGPFAKGASMYSCSSTGHRNEKSRLKSDSLFSPALSYGSFTTYEKLSSKKVHGEGDALAPVRRSSRIRNQLTSP